MWRSTTRAPAAFRARRMIAMPMRIWFALLVALATATGACETAAIVVTWTKVVTGLSKPTDIANAGDASGRLFVAEQAGKIRVVRGAQILTAPFLDLAGVADQNDERGLLGVAFHPQYATNGLFFVNYNRAGDGATVIARYRVSAGNPDVADPASATILLTLPAPSFNHVGGGIKFGPDGFLYIASGDGGSPYDPLGRAQDPASLFGKILRIDVDHGNPYAIPAGNPFAAGGGAPEVFAIGLRNPWRLGFDRVTGDLWIGDVGEDVAEEVDYLAAGTGAGANFGWRVMEGTHCTGRSGALPCNDPALVLPVIEYGHDLGCSLTGGFVYRGTAVPALSGRYVYGDFCSGRLWAATRNPLLGGWTSEELGMTATTLSTFGESDAGELYFADYAAGNLYRIDGEASGTADVIEYYNAGFDHYFISSLPADIEALDSGKFKGWARTGKTFKTYPAPNAAATPVCRFYLPPAFGDSHFYGRSPAECVATAEKFPGFVLESPNVMYMVMPVSGVCPAATVPVYRVFSNRADANHRYTIERAIRDQMVAMGWLPEGDGPDQVVMCAPP
jgi:glucose/arabinose dehydrogenase